MDHSSSSLVAAGFYDSLHAIAEGSQRISFDCTHHPAMSVPCAKSDGLPIGMMLIGRHFEEDIVLRAAHAFEKAGIYS